MNREQNSCLLGVKSVYPQVATGGVNGQAVDLRGADAATVFVSVGAITGSAGDATLTLEESDSAGSGYTAVAAADIVGSTPTLAANTGYQFGYKGSKRYVRAVFTLGGETNVAINAIVVKGLLSQEPDGQTFAS